MGGIGVSGAGLAGGDHGRTGTAWVIDGPVSQALEVRSPRTHPAKAAIRTCKNPWLK